MAPFVSCLCPTFGRFPEYGHLLGEAVESFARQSYPVERRELIILNDCPRQKLVCGVPGVRVINLPQRLGSLGAKYNLLCEVAKGELLLPWEDDDLSLSKRIAQAVTKSILVCCLANYWNPGRTWFYAQQAAGPEGTGLHWRHNHGYCHNASVFSKEAWRKVGCYAQISGAQDADMDVKLRKLGPPGQPLSDDPAEWTYIYCWGRSNIHLSGSTTPDQSYRDWGQQPHQAGTFEIKPGWHHDYEETCRLACLERSGSIPP